MYNYFMRNAYDILEINKIREELSSYAYTEIGKYSSLKNKEFPLVELNNQFALLKEMDLAISYKGNMPFNSSLDLTKPISLAKKGSSLSKEIIYSIGLDIDNGLTLSSYIKSLEEKMFPCLREIEKRFPSLDFILERIRKSIAPDLSIFDDASIDLKRIRREIYQIKKQADRITNEALLKNKEYLTSFSYTLKNGHFVLPVSTSFKNKVKGIIQDVSSTGSTTFIEPEEIVSLNNRIFVLNEEEKREIEKILFELSKLIASNGEEILTLNKLIGDLDFLQARVLWGRKYKGHVPTLGDYVYLPNSRHPLLNQDKVIANTIILKKETRVCIISGPNAGGKTVILKTLGLFALMFKLGYMLPTEQGAILPYFRNIYADIGDSQSLMDNLSTFSGHCSNLSSILDNVGGLDLVLLDEVGTGTSPNEGEALAESIVTYLLKKHCFALISSHFESLKSFGLTNKNIINASMEFDNKSLLPTYHLLLGLPGESYGLLVARRFGINEEVLGKANELLHSKQVGSLQVALNKLSISLNENKALNEKLEKKIQILEKKEKELKSKEIALLTKEKEIKEYNIDKNNQILEKAKQEVEEIISSLSRPNVKLHQAIEAKKKLEDLYLEEKEEEILPSSKLVLNDYCEIPSFGIVGKITRINGKRIEISTPNGFVFNSTVDKAIKCSPPKEIKQGISGKVLDSLSTSKGLPLELNLLGLRYEEAKNELDHYLDSCRLKGYKRVRIIHGLGSGALKRMCQEFIKNHSSFIEKSEPAGEYEGGAGATIIYLK